jgi:hypothetical protein
MQGLQGGRLMPDYPPNKSIEDKCQELLKEAELNDDLWYGTPEYPPINFIENKLLEAESSYLELLEEVEEQKDDLLGSIIYQIRSDRWGPLPLEQNDKYRLEVEHARQKIELWRSLLQRAKDAIGFNLNKTIGERRRFDKDIVRAYARGAIKHTHDMKRDALAEEIMTNTEEGSRYGLKTIVDWIRPLFPDYTPLKSGRKPKK